MDYFTLDYHRDQDRFAARDLDLIGSDSDPSSRPPMDWLNNSRNHRDNDQPWDTAEHRNPWADEF